MYGMAHEEAISLVLVTAVAWSGPFSRAGVSQSSNLWNNFVLLTFPNLPSTVFLQVQSLPQAREVAGGTAIYAGSNTVHPNNIHRCKGFAKHRIHLPGASSYLKLSYVKADLFSSHTCSGRAPGDPLLLEGLNRMNPYLLNLSRACPPELCQLRGWPLCPGLVSSCPPRPSTLSTRWLGSVPRACLPLLLVLAAPGSLSRPCPSLGRAVNSLNPVAGLFGWLLDSINCMAGLCVQASWPRRPDLSCPSLGRLGRARSGIRSRKARSERALKRERQRKIDFKRNREREREQGERALVCYGWLAGLLSSLVLCAGLCVRVLSSSCPCLGRALELWLASVARLTGEECGRTNRDVNADKNSLMKQFILGIKVGPTKKSIFFKY